MAKIKAVPVNEFTANLTNALVALGKEFMEHSDKYINPNSEYTSEVNIWINFPSATDDPCRVPTIRVEHEMYPGDETLNELMKAERRKEKI